MTKLILLVILLTLTAACGSAPEEALPTLYSPNTAAAIQGTNSNIIDESTVRVKLHVVCSAKFTGTDAATTVDLCERLIQSVMNGNSQEYVTCARSFDIETQTDAFKSCIRDMGIEPFF